jgi:hypothetical protein
VCVVTTVESIMNDNNNKKWNHPLLGSFIREHKRKKMSSCSSATKAFWNGLFIGVFVGVIPIIIVTILVPDLGVGLWMMVLLLFIIFIFLMAVCGYHCAKHYERQQQQEIDSPLIVVVHPRT